MFTFIFFKLNSYWFIDNVKPEKDFIQYLAHNKYKMIIVEYTAAINLFYISSCQNIHLYSI